MKYSYNWLKELSGTKKNVDEIAELFMTHSFEVEGVEDLSKGLDNVVIGEVLKVEKHPDADRLRVAMVNVEPSPQSSPKGRGSLQIVCGAPNLEVGQKVPVALVGAKLPNPHPNPLPEGEEAFFEIKKSEIRGVESHGMICAEDELGVGTDHDGIMVLDGDAPVGESFAKYMGLNDQILDIDILPNRGHDCLSYDGVANELRALEDNNSKTSSLTSLPEAEEDLDVFISTPKCNRYIGAKIDNIEIKESPNWLKARLQASGISPKNNIVDITNYIMLKTGQPLHAFNADVVDKIEVRQANDGEKITLLDDVELELDADDIVITDGESPIALAGVMGGKNSAISDETKNIILESASFDATSIRFTQRKYNLQTDAAYRFERDLDPNLSQIAIVEAIELIKELANGEVTALNDVYPSPLKPWTIKSSVSKVNKLLGVDISQEQQQDILERLGMKVEIVDEDVMNIVVPTVRLDIKTQEDVTEEIGRIYGYNKITPKPLKSAVQTPTCNEERFFERTLKDIFVYGGFDEVRSYSFASIDDVESIGLDDENHITLLNPANSNQALMRRTLMSHLLQHAKKNMSYFDRIQIFEIGRIYDPVDNALPDEKLVLGAVILSKDQEGSQFFELKGILETLLDRINIGQYYFDSEFDENVQHLPNLHPSRRALIKMEDGTILGWMGEIDKKANKYFGFKKNRVVYCELDISTMMQKVESENFFEPLAKFPFVSRDLSMLVGDRVRVGDVERVIYATGGELIKDVDLFDLYQNEETGKRSMAFHIIFGADNRTLEAKDVDEKIAIIIEALENEIDVEIRK